MTTPISQPETVQTSAADLAVRFPNVVSAETRPGYKGWIILKENLVEVATILRDEFGYDLLSSVTAVDYFPENRMEVVYHAYKTTGGPGLVFRVQVPREEPIEVPSLIDVWPGVDFQEREAWDLWN
jgi:NADH:ubiquinone oxidoreductase subunit C